MTLTVSARYLQEIPAIAPKKWAITKEQQATGLADRITLTKTNSQERSNILNAIGGPVPECDLSRTDLSRGDSLQGTNGPGDHWGVKK